MLYSKNADPLLRRFQLQFIAVNIAFVFVLLVAVLGLGSSIAHSLRVDDIHDELVESLERVERLVPEDRYEITEFGVGLSPEERTPGASRPRQPQALSDGRRDTLGDPVIATSSYLVNNEGALVAIVFDQLDLDESTLTEAFVDVVEQQEGSEGEPFGDKGDIHGEIHSLNLYYHMRPFRDGYSIAFASGGYVDRGTANTVKTLALLELLVLLALAGLSVVLSRWAMRPVERAWTQQRQFIADASHELKTPLSVIRANDSLLMADPQASVASQMQWIESTEAEANLMQDLVNDMLFLAQSENVDNALVKTRVNLSDVVQASVLQFESVAFERNVAISDAITPDVYVNGEAKSLARMVATLIDNACKYASDGGSVKVHLWKQGSSCFLRVHNTGVAIPAEDVPHVFDRFYRSDKARTQGQGGFGLGLAIAKSIIDDHKGSVAVASNEADGTAFTVTLPVAS